MKALLVVLVLGSVQMMSVTAQASVKCKVTTNDVGTIVGVGASRDDAQADAAFQCFDRHDKLSVMKTGASLGDNDAGVTVANNCTNVRCG